MEVDHFYFCTEQANDVADLLKEFGLKEGQPNTHPGQGTTNRRFFFQNSMMELLYITNEKETHTERTKVLGIAQQFKNPKQNKIGIIFRPSESEERTCPFECVQYKPMYLPDNLYMDIGCSTYKSEPKYIFLNFINKPKNRDDVYHEIDGTIVKNVTKITLYLKSKSISKTTKIIESNSNLNIVTQNEDMLEIELDNGKMKKHKNFFPLIPLRIRW